MLDRKIVLGTLGCVTCIAISSQLFAGELTPYRLPSQENYPQTRSSPPIQQQSDGREKYYRDFAEKAKNLSGNERKRLINSFSQKQQVAQKNGNYDEAGHYLRLMEILSKENK